MFEQQRISFDLFKVMIRMLRSMKDASVDQLVEMQYMLGFVRLGVWLLPHEANKLNNTSAEKRGVVRLDICHGQGPVMLNMENKHFVMLCPPNTTEDMVLHEMAHVELGHIDDIDAIRWPWQKVIDEFQANRLAIKNGADPTLMAAGMATYLPGPDFLRRRLAAKILGAETPPKNVFPLVQMPPGFIEMWEQYLGS